MKSLAPASDDASVLLGNRDPGPPAAPKVHFFGASDSYTGSITFQQGGARDSRSRPGIAEVQTNIALGRPCGAWQPSHDE